MSLPFKTHMIPLQHKIIHCSCKTVSSCLEPKGTLNHIPLGSFTSSVLRLVRLTPEVSELRLPRPTQQASAKEPRAERGQEALSA